MYAGALIFLGYEGFELIANASEDARDPDRTLPRAYLVAIGGVIALYVLVAFVAVGNLPPHAIATESDYALAAAARPFLGQAGFTLIAVAAVVSTGSAINATLYGAAKFTYLMGRDGELPARFGRPVWNRPIGGLLATTAGTLVIVSTVNIEGISLMGSAGFLIIFAAARCWRWLRPRARRGQAREPRLEVAVVRVLVVNAGSSSLKLRVLDGDDSVTGIIYAGNPPLRFCRIVSRAGAGRGRAAWARSRMRARAVPASTARPHST